MTSQRSTTGRARHDQRPRRESLSKRLGKVARQIKARDGGRCVYCRPPQRISDLHPDAVSVLALQGLLTTDRELSRHVGRLVRFTAPWEPRHGTQVRDEVFRVVGVQLDSRGRRCWRVVCDAEGDTFGRPAHPSEWTPVDGAN
jgi:hypothetical protein